MDGEEYEKLEEILKGSKIKEILGNDSSEPESMIKKLKKILKQTRIQADYTEIIAQIRSG